MSTEFNFGLSRKTKCHLNTKGDELLRESYHYVQTLTANLFHCDHDCCKNLNYQDHLMDVIL